MTSDAHLSDIYHILTSRDRMMSAFDARNFDDPVPAENAPAAHAPAPQQPAAGPNYKSLDDLARELGPFRPPNEFDHGDEFDPPVPRRIPRRLRKGSYASRQRATVATLLVVGIDCLFYSRLPFVSTLSFYVLPLAYLDYLGAFLILIAVVKAARYLFGPGLFRYVTHGIPINGRVLATEMSLDQSNPQLYRYALSCLVEYPHPETNRLEYARCVTPDSWVSAKLPKISQTVTAGDYVTLVALPESIDTSIRLYGYLGLDPDREFVLKNNKPLTAVSAFSVLLIASAVLAGLGLVFAGMHVVINSFPDDGAPWKFFAGVGSGIVAALVTRWIVRRYRRRKAQSVSPVISQQSLGPIGTGILGAFAGGIVLCLLNSLPDRVPGTIEPVRIVNFWSTTHNFIIRTYEIEYQKLSDQNPVKKFATIQDIERLRATGVDAGHGLAVIDHAHGYFGLRWTRGIYPIIWESTAMTPLRSPVTATIEMPNGLAVQRIQLTPLIQLRDAEYAALDEQTAQVALKELPGLLAPGQRLVPATDMPAGKP